MADAHHTEPTQEQRTQEQRTQEQPTQEQPTQEQPIQEQHQGGCLCGGVRYTVEGPLRDVFDCHCIRCRRFTGHHMAATAASPERVRFDSDSSLRWFSPQDDPAVAYGFCATCGSSMFWRADAHPEKLSIAAGTIDGTTGLTTTRAWWVSDAGDYYRRPEGVVEFATE